MRKLQPKDKNVIIKGMIAVGIGFFLLNMITQRTLGRQTDYSVILLWAIVAALSFGFFLYLLLKLSKTKGG